MARGTRGRRRISSRNCRATPYPVFTCNHNLSNGNEKKSSTIIMPKKDLEDITCSVCMEYPHNAVLLLCSSHDKGCRPYMCGTSSRYSNCLGQYKKAYTKITFSSPHHPPPLTASDDSPELACPLCRGQVKGWTVVESAREYLNCKKRTCMHDNCSFIGAYKELKKHVKSEHPSAKPREVDPNQEQKWRQFEREREWEDVISTVTSSMPGSVVFGDYVIERNLYGSDSDDDEVLNVDDLRRGTNGGLDVTADNNFVNVFLMFHGGSEGPFGRNDSGDANDDSSGGGGGMSLVNRLRRQGSVLPGRRRRSQT